MKQDPVQHLLQRTVEAVALLERLGEDHWARWLRADLVSLRRRDGYGIEHLLSAFGGMGSLNDLVISPDNGHDVDPAEGEAMTTRLRVLLSDIYDTAISLR